jgi:nitroimidazol reductase NimA-like FMN-containing flavoprotein (pyridoxamine 5'-phosphate oxidase superfamily)
VTDALRTTERTTITRLPERGRDDRAEANAILDEAYVAHVGISTDHGPRVIPTTFARVDDTIIIHGSPAAGWLRLARQGPSGPQSGKQGPSGPQSGKQGPSGPQSGKQGPSGPQSGKQGPSGPQSGKPGTEVCFTVTLLDGLVVARSAFHHSMNYRSVVVLGTAVPVEDHDAKRAALRAITNKVLPGRMDEVRDHTDKEVRGTLVLALPLDEASVKVRTGGPKDDEEDMDGPAWAGVIPLALVFGPPIPAEDLRAGIAVPASVRSHR